MKNFVLGVVVGLTLAAAVGYAAGKDSLGRSPEQQRYDYYRERQQQLDIQHMRKQQDQQELDRKLGRKPC
jgi:hypothetical protein